MKMLSSVQAILVALAFTADLQADDFSEHFIAAKAGVVNYIEGRPQVFFGNEGKVAETRGQVKVGDSIKTGAQDRLEILLNPGSYLRLGFNSELLVVDTAFDSMKFELTRGSAIVESATFNRKVHALRLATPAGDVVFEKAGLYRLEVQPSAVYLAIHEGKAKWMKEGVEVATLKSGRRFVLAVPTPVGEVQFAKLDKKDADELDHWSRRRAEFLVAANSRLSPWLMTSLSDRYGYNQRGGWMFNPWFGCYTFVPFDGTFGSPYGFRYGMFLPVRIYRSAPSYGWDGPSNAGGYGRSSAPATTYDQRSTAISAPSAPAARMESGRAEQDNRSSTLGSIRNR
jgi:FecR protein